MQLNRVARFFMYWWIKHEMIIWAIYMKTLSIADCVLIPDEINHCVLIKNTIIHQRFDVLWYAARIYLGYPDRWHRIRRFSYRFLMILLIFVFSEKNIFNLNIYLLWQIYWMK